LFVTLGGGGIAPLHFLQRGAISRAGGSGWRNASGPRSGSGWARCYGWALVMSQWSLVNGIPFWLTSSMSKTEGISPITNDS
jgi:hypothetical protein